MLSDADWCIFLRALLSNRPESDETRSDLRALLVGFCALHGLDPGAVVEQQLAAVQEDPTPDGETE